MKLAFAVLALGLAASPAAAGPCLEPGLMPIVISPLGATIDQFGGVVVAAVPWREGVNEDPVVQPTWEFVEGKQRGKPKITVIAPGLAVYAPKAPVQALELQDKTGRAVGRVKFQFQNTDDMPMDAAPRPTAVIQAKKARMSSNDTVTATLAEAPPAGTIAVLVRAAGGKTTAPRSWNRLYDLKTTKIVVYAYDRCEPVIPGTVATKAGDKIELAWLDAEGHVSLWSPAIAVTAEK
ncbi:MAG: hypothetical protein JNL83_26940 [Myxococcales bacterium]|nr:hypothetical protein [Myxococcales bacterium]